MQYDKALQAWLKSPAISWVCEETSLPRGLVKRLVEKGAPHLGRGPFPKTTTEPTAPARKKSLAPPEDVSAVQAKLVLVRQEARAKMEQIKASLRQAEEEAAKVAALVTDPEQEAEIVHLTEALSVAERRADREDRRIATVEKRAIAADNVTRAATEAAASTIAMENVMKVGAIMAHLTDRLLQHIEAGEVTLPRHVDSRMLGSLTNSADRLTSAVERAIKIAQGRAGAPEKVLGVQIGVLIDGCTPRELDSVIETGKIPSRLRLAVGGHDD